MRRKIGILCLLTGLMCLCTYAWFVQSEQQAVADQLVRLHIVADSDDPADQRVKLQVRDRILPVISRLTEGCLNRSEAIRALQSGLPSIRQAASEALCAAGYSEEVQLSLQPELFPRREYDTFSLPAGEYETLRVTIGKGQGHNWWCVAFPALCLPASSEGVVEAARIAGLSDEQTDLLTGDSFDITLKFRLLDWLANLPFFQTPYAAAKTPAP